MKLSLDDGRTWVDAPDSIRVIWADVREDDGESLDLHLNVTSEGLIVDVVGQVSGQVSATASLDLDTLADEVAE